ncbi:S-layer homology domain-containing protein [Paenibacillus sp. IB182496]|uniref:S-layer homology domain-containing protein n=1 Tax=Paenibacillus sabuli TaxID=2772509 RepID=A0A927GU66_9BACL|nr:chitobiase/beta-hexosaminidase C-terminal domain-containing protein [Paenibacillus sabuli]MBD2847397.1 S-layer homology domain-containing protein [Paenibacillus sabuli]
MRKTSKRSFRIAAAAVLAVAAIGTWLLAAGAAGSKWTDYTDTSWFYGFEQYDTYTLSSPAELAAVAELVNSGTMTGAENGTGRERYGFEGKIIEIAADMDLDAHDWVPIGTEAHPFRGTLLTLDGQNFTIANMRILGDVPYAGLVGYAQDATIGGFTLAGGGELDVQSVAQTVYGGAAVGKMSGLGTIYDIVSEVPISVEGGQTVYAGGIAGYAEGSLSNSAYEASALTATGADVEAGGVVGHSGPAGLTLKRVANETPLTVASPAYSGRAIGGGIAGAAEGQLLMEEDGTPIVNEGAVTVRSGSSSYAGGIVGRADGAVSFSTNTSNDGAVTIDAPQATLSAAGGLIGAITAEQGGYPFDTAFDGRAAIVNDGGSRVYTGGIAGLLDTTSVWADDLASPVAVSATGRQDVHTGGLFGHASGTVQFDGEAVNSGAITVAAPADGELNEAYTGGLIGYGGDRILLEDTGVEAYGNSGAIEVSGDVGLYTGGVAGNRTFARSTGAAGNAYSTGEIRVAGERLLYTGGYIGTVPGDAPEHRIDELAFAGSITVTGSGATEEAPVATGGIVGRYTRPAGNEAALAGLSFGGAIDAQGGGAYTYSGGIAGIADHAELRDARAAGTDDAHAQIVTDGHAGGIAGQLVGELDGAQIVYTTLTVRTPDGYAGGAAALAQGSMSGVRVGDADSESDDTVLVRADIPTAADDADNLTGGGIVGLNSGELALTDSEVHRTTLSAADGRSGYTLGGVAGELTGEATVGAAGQPIVADHVSLQGGTASDSRLAGGLGRSEVTAVQLLTRDVRVDGAGADLVAGGAIGVNGAIQSAEQTVIETLRTVIAGTGADMEAGGIAGTNSGRLVNASATDGSITLDGAASAGGGIAGSNTGDIAASAATNMALSTAGPGTALGGAVGMTAPAVEGAAAPTIADVLVQAHEAVLVTASAADVRAGGIAGRSEGAVITNPTVMAEDSDYVILSLAAPGIRAGGVAGQTVGGSIAGTGDTDYPNLRQVFLTATAAAAEAHAGGVTGYSEETRIADMTARVLNISLGAEDGVAGGVAGYFRGSETAVVTGSYMDTLGIKALEGATGAIVGGAVGVNDSRAYDADADPASAVSTLHNTRIIGNTANSNSPVVESRAANAIAGGMIGENRSLVANDSIADKIKVLSRGAGSVVGGHTGVNRAAGTLYYAYANSDLTIQGQDVHAGGLVGLNEGEVLASYVDVDVTGSAEGTAAHAAALGGLIGVNEGLVERSYSVSNVSADGAFMLVGGVVGDHRDGTIRYSYAGKDVKASGAGSYAGGFAGRIAAGTISDSYSAAKVTMSGSAEAGGFAGRYDNDSKNLLYKVYYIKDEAVGINKDLPDFAEGNYRWLNVPARLSTLLAETLRDRGTFPDLSGWDFDAVWRYGSLQAEYRYPELIRTANNGGGGGPDVNANLNWYTRNPNAITFEISSEAELAGLAALVNGTVLGLEREDFAERTVRITRPIHIQSSDWVAIGAAPETPFEGNLEGGGHLIDGLKIAPGQPYSGLFGVVGEQGRIAEVVLEPLGIGATETAGALVGLNRGAIDQATVRLLESVTVTGRIVGGIAGSSSGTLTGLSLTLEEGAAVVAVGTDAAAGGLIGEQEGVVTPAALGELDLAGEIRSAADGAVLGGYIGRQQGEVNGLVVPITYRVTGSGAATVLGGVVGHQRSGGLIGLDVTLEDGSELTASAGDSTVGGVVGLAESAAPLESIALLARADAAPISGGIVGGIAGDKTGQGTAAIDVRELQAGGVQLTTPQVATETVAGGLIGRLRDAVATELSFAGSLRPRSDRTTLGGVVGAGADSVLREVEAEPQVRYQAVSGASALGGVAGAWTAADLDDAVELGSVIPYYTGLYDVRVPGGSIEASGSGAADLTLGGIVGTLDASLYFGESAIALEAREAHSATVGGLVGESRGIVVSSHSAGAVRVEQSTLVRAGGAIGAGEGGALHDSHVDAAADATVTVAAPVTRQPDFPVVQAGGLIGAADGMLLRDASSDMAVVVTSESLEDTIYAGGFAGALGERSAIGDGEIADAYATGSVRVDARTTAIAGGFAGSVNRYAVSRAYASGAVDNAGYDTRTGGFAGAVEREAAIDASYAVQAELHAAGVNHPTRAYMGGFAGYNDGELSDIYAHASELALEVTGANAYKGGLVGYQYRDGSTTDSAYAAAQAAIGHDAGSASALTREDRLATLQLERWLLRTDASFLMGDGADGYAAADPLQWRTAVLLTNDDTQLELYRLFDRAATDVAAADTRLTADMDLTDMIWVPYRDFRQTLDGQGHTVSGLRLEADAGALGLATHNYGTIRGLALTDAEVRTGAAAADAAGLLAGVNHAGAVLADVDVSGTIQAGIAGGIVGRNAGAVQDAAADVVVSGEQQAGGIAGANEADATVGAASAQGTVQGAVAGGIAGTNAGAVQDASSDAVVSGEQQAGGVAGINEASGTISGAATQGTTKAAVAGGIAGVNEGRIAEAATGGAVQAGIAGGIAGELRSGGRIETAFAYGEVTAAAAGAQDATAGGIAGLSAGALTGAHYSGVVSASVSADGSERARAGGIAGYATDGRIADVWNAGEVRAEAGGVIVRGRVFFGGIAGQREAQADIAAALYNRQMLKTDTAYYNASGVRVSGAVAGAAVNDGGRAAGVSAAELAGGSLLQVLDASLWQAGGGFYPQLRAYAGTPRAELAAAALLLDEQDTVYRVTAALRLTADGALRWTSSGAAISGAQARLTAASGGVAFLVETGELQRMITIRKTAPRFEETAQAPRFATAEGTFDKRVEVELATNEANGAIYYTLDGAQPQPGRAGTIRYTGPITLEETTTIRALTVAEDKEPSAVAAATWTRKSSGPGMFFPMPPLPPAPAPIVMTVGDRELEAQAGEPLQVARNSRLVLNVPDGVTLYYTTDGTEPTTASAIYTGAIVIAGDMTLKYITSTDSQVVTVTYTVQPAQFEIRADAPTVRYMASGANGRFRPGEAITRGELVLSLAELLQFEELSVASQFADVPRGRADLIAQFASADIIQGYPDGTFRGERGLTRAEFVVVMSRVLGLDTGAAGTVEFADVQAHWSAPYVEAFVRAGYVNGYPDGTFRPNRLITRAEAVVLINRLIGTSTTAAAGLGFADVPEQHWAYEAIMAAARGE